MENAQITTITIISFSKHFDVLKMIYLHDDIFLFRLISRFYLRKEFPLRPFIILLLTVEIYGIELFTRFLFVENEQPAAEQAIRIEKNIEMWGDFSWSAAMEDTTSTEYITTHQLFVDFFNAIFDGIKTKYG